MMDDMSGLDQRKIAAALSAAVAAAEGEEAKIVVALVDRGGNLCGLLHMPSAFLASRDYAEWKAWTAASFALATTGLAAMLDSQEAHVREGLLAHPKVTALPGGIPLHRDGVLIGAVGVSGGSGEQDVRIAEAAAKAALA
ncbi:MAG: heme-binding protein [Parasphingopyxis sp.]